MPSDGGYAVKVDDDEPLSVRLCNYAIGAGAGSESEAVYERVMEFMLAYADSIFSSEALIRPEKKRVAPSPEAPSDWAGSTPLNLADMQSREEFRLFGGTYNLAIPILEDYVHGTLALANLKALVRRVEPRHPGILEGYLCLAGENIDATSLMKAEIIPWPPRNPFKRIAEDKNQLPLASPNVSLSKALARETGVSRSTIERVLRGEPRKAASSVVAAMSRWSGIDADRLSTEYMLWKGNLRLVCLGSPPKTNLAERLESGISLRDLEVDVLMDVAEILMRKPPLRRCDNPECRRLFIARRPSVDRFCRGTCRARWDYLNRCGLIP